MDDLDEELWIASRPPPEERRPEPGCVGVLALFAVGYVIASSGLWAPVLFVALGWGLLQGTR